MNNTDMKRVCSDCVAYVAGQCRRYPPIQMQIDRHTGYEVVKDQIIDYPYVGPEFPACGEFHESAEVFLKKVKKL
jgi:hypothetical protein